MSDHEFEKQVRQKLEDLKLTPSASAWENIEQGLREGKRRRAPLFYLLLLFTGIGAGGYFIYSSNQNSSTLSDKVVTNPNAQTNKILKTKETGNLKNSETNKEYVKEAETRSSKPNSTQTVSENTESTPLNKASVGGSKISGRDVQRPVVERSEIVQPERSRFKGNKKSHKDEELISQDEIKKTKPDKLNDADLKKNQAGEDLAKINRITDPDKSKISPADKSDGSGKKQPIIKEEEKPSPALAKPATARKKISGKWSFGISAFAGISAVNEGKFLNFSKPQVEDVSYTPDFLQQSFAPSYKPSAISPGFSYSIGGTVRRELSKKLSLTVGLNYLQLNTHNKVGNRMYGSQIVNNGTRGYITVANYFMLEQDRSSEYRNRYHFIDIPVSLHTRINKSKKLPLNWNAGFSVSRLLKSNSLHFDGTTGVYYKNDKLLNQTQAAVTTGFSLTLFNNTKHPVWIGPTARYNVSKILQKDVSAKKNFMSLGVDMKLFIKR